MPELEKNYVRRVGIRKSLIELPVRLQGLAGREGLRRLQRRGREGLRIIELRTAQLLSYSGGQAVHCRQHGTGGVGAFLDRKRRCTVRHADALDE